MNIKNIKAALGLLNSMVTSNEKHSVVSEEVVSKALKEINSIEEAKVRWFRVCGDGSIGAQTTPHGHGEKILCKIIPVDRERKVCEHCGHAITEQEVT